MNNNSNLSEFSESLKQYVRTTIEIIKLELIERTVIICSYILIQTIKWILFGVGVLMFSIAIAIYISESTGDYSLGFGCVGLFYLIVAIIISLLNQKNVEKSIQNKIIKHIFSDEHTVDLNK